MDLKQVLQFWVRPALSAIGFAGSAPESLMLGTGLVESGYEWLAQEDNGPARSPWQIEKATHDDIHRTFLAYRPELAATVAKWGSEADDMARSPIYGCIIGRLKYVRVPEALPAWDDPAGLAAYHKVHYNTELGAANILTNTALFKIAVQTVKAMQ